ncbi:alpha/beta hydrolase [Solitalea canadensis]|uniref:Esterase/lipase n=1 Tax=Solitalea canadensis (strain ATCC 29591 / DSM 3403 / JCM 21819 / LMG 8368 / NBRC 15130 / NCIMB 12057 / USAM 9D) TaxID=929556 RepID=H8KWG5_SOLCM|nr:alpha/beta hydrolase [Solitalea canadensis]AFD08083.1 esterase/lipase [Solitalea canadensis DSM 3403]
MNTHTQTQHLPKDYATDPHLSSLVKEFLKPLNAGGPPLESLPVDAIRNVLVAAQSSVNADLSGISEAVKTIKQDGNAVEINIVKPEGKTDVTPVFMFIHGGGWVLGDYPTHIRMVRDLVVLTRYTGVFVNYSRSPEAKYPQALNEVYVVAKWLASNGTEIGVDGKKLAIAGNSAGGNLSTATTLMAKAKGGPEFKVQLLMWPVTDADFERSSYHKFGVDRFLTTSLMKWMWDQYADLSQRNEIYAAPIQATVDELKGLPPTLIQTAENDILRNEGEAYGRKLGEAGVDVTTVRYNDVIHDFGLLNVLATIPQTKAAFIHAAAYLKKYLG